MADSKHNRRYGDWSMVGDDAFSKIAERMDITSAVRLAICSKELYRQVKGAEGSRCPNDGCGTLVGYGQYQNHKIACPEGPCSCMEDGCEFAGPPAALLAHLAEAHSMAAQTFPYGEEHRYTSRPVPAPGSRRVDLIGSGDDGTVFAVQFSRLDDHIGISVVCLRSEKCLSPCYVVLLRCFGDCGRVANQHWAFQPSNTTSPGSVSVAELYSSSRLHRDQIVDPDEL